MKSRTFLLGASLVGNAVLLAVIFDVSRAEKSTRTAASSLAAEAAVTSAKYDAARAWRELQSGDLKLERDHLAAEGFPPSIVRAILEAKIHERFAARYHALTAESEKIPFWKTLYTPKYQADRSAIAREEQQVIKELLGPDPDHRIADGFRRQFPNLSPASIEALTSIQQRFDDQRQEVYSSVRGMYLPSDSAKLRAINDAMHAEIQATLAPAEMDDYDLRTSDTANQLRFRLKDFGATEDEFRALYKLQSAFDAQIGRTYGPMTPAQSQAWNDGQKTLNAAAAAALGPERYAEYQRSGDYNYQQTVNLVARIEAPPETANTLYALQKEYQQRQQDLYKAQRAAGGAVDVQAQVTALQQEATARVSALLGGDPDFVDAYKQYGGQWLNNLAPRPASPKK